jgi:DNA-binding protein HU-beta
MNKSELIEKMAEEAGITKAQAQAALNAFITSSAQALKQGDKISLIGLGTFSVSERSARKGRNPKTGKEINIAAKKLVRFKAGKALKGL